MTGSTTKRISTAFAAGLFLAALPVVSRAAVVLERVSHTATLLTTGDLLLVGGLDVTDTVTNSVQKLAASRGPYLQDMLAIPTARSSHTATLLPNSCVLVAGGNTGGGVATSDVQIYDPQLNTWSSPADMVNARYNHTATLLNTGKVLVCGGQSDAAGTPVQSCELFTPGANCTTGSWAAAAGTGLLLARYNHTAVLLKDGRVWIAGGSSATTGGFQATTERYDPLTDVMQSASPLIEARAHHTATLMGDGKVLLVGGYNGRNILANQGVLDTSEIYDPVGNSISPAAQLTARRQSMGTLLHADGVVISYGGLGNVTTTYVNPSGPAKAGSFLTTAYSAVTTGTVTGGTILLDVDELLSKPVIGQITNGEIWYSSPAFHFPSGMALLYPSSPTIPTFGIRSSVNGKFLGCRLPVANPVGNCGNINEIDLPITNMQGQVVYYPKINIGPIGAANLTSGNMVFAGGPLTGGSLPLSPASNITTTITIGMGRELVGYNIINGTMRITNGSFTQSSSFTVTITSGTGTIPVTPIVADIAGNGEATFTITFNNLEGDITWAGEPGYSASSPFPVPDGPSAVGLSLTMRQDYVASGVDLLDQTFSVDVATIVVRKMTFADREFYDPKANIWTLTPPGGGTSGVNTLDRRFSHAATLMPNDDAVITGGRTCSNFTCSSLLATSTRPIGGVLGAERNYNTLTNSLQAVRALHTATLLPSGKILLAGGTNGPNVLKSAELFDPATEASAFTAGPMTHVRDLHSATLLPNGRVLIAGGFTTNASSTGSTNTAELYYPEFNRFIETTPMISSRSNHSAIMLPDGRVFVAGGFGPDDVITGTAEIFISTENRWQAAATMPGGCQRTLHGTVQLKTGQILMIGGLNSGGVLNTTARYDPATDSWNCGAVAAMPTALRSHTATLLFDGSVLVAGGNDGFGEANVSYIYDPLANTWTATHETPFYEPRFNHTATLLPNGNVTISGGSQKFGNVPTTLESFHVNASSWVGGVPFKAGTRAFHTMTLALNNKLYGIGGSDGTIGGPGVSLWGQMEGGYFTSVPDGYSKNAPPSIRQSTISTTSDDVFLPGIALTVEGNQFRGGTEASGGGSASAYSAFSFPHMVLQQVDGSGGGGTQSNGGFVVDLTTQIYLNSSNFNTLNTSVTVALPATSNQLPYGWYALRMGANDIYSEGKLLQVGPDKPTAAPTGFTFATQGISSITWTWNQIAGADGYSVYNATTGVFLSTIPQSVTPTYYQTGLQPSATSSILVAAYTLTGDGPLSASPTTYALSTTPAQVTIASVTFSDLLLYWSANSNAAPGTVYEVSQSTDGFVTSFSTPVPTIFNLTDTFTTINNLAGNTTYYFRVRAFNLVGLASPFSAVVSTRTRTSVGQPTLGGRTTTSITWTWSNPGSVNNFKVYNATSGVLLATLPGNIITYTDGGLSTNSIRSVQVSAVTGAGEGPLSPSASFYTMAATPVTATPPIPVVTLTTGSFQLSWLPSDGNPLNTPYRVFITEYSPGGAITSTFSVLTTAYDLGMGALNPSTLYGYTIVAINGDGVESDTPAVVVGSTWTLPAQPIPLTVLGTDPSSISITWNTNNNSSSATYQVTYTTDNFITNTSTSLPFSANYNGNTHVITGLITSTTYTIWVVARNPFGQLSAFSNQVTTRTFNGGAAAGSIAGLFQEANDSQLFGTLGNGRQITLRAPAHTFPSDVVVTVSSFLPVGTLCPGATNIAFSITNDPALQPNGSLYLTFAFTPAELGTIPTKRALLLRYDPGSNSCVPLETSIDTGGGFMTARINHFSLFQVGQVPAATNAETARVFPNPYYAGRDGYATIDNVPAGARIRIFTLRGEQVFDQVANGAGLLTWSGTNGAGRAVASGVYIVMVEAEGSKKVFKLALIR